MRLLLREWRSCCCRILCCCHYCHAVELAILLCLCLSQGADYDAFIKVAQKTEDATFVQVGPKDIAPFGSVSA
jgi:hypothetical protein